jgi:superfamily II DNA/RNA helicase
MTEFTDLGLSPTTLQAVADTGYTTATPIQAAAIPVALQGRDVLGIAQTGTGKTAAFTLPMIDRLAAGRAKARMPRALVLAPTRELADQVAASFEKYAKGTKLSWALLIGGVSMADQVSKLDKGVDVLIATPGRLLDLFERSKILLTGVQIMVVDEADRMLDMGFIPDIERIFKLTPPRRQTLFFSATMPPEITRLTKQFLNDPERIEATRPATTADTIAQHLVRVPSSEPKAKRMALRALMARETVRNGIVFCNRKTEVDIVAKSLKVHGLDAAPIHGDLDQALRMRTLDAFRKGELKFLVASDVAARGLDIPDVSHVFNYDVPHHADDYVHRIGRTGRAGKLGETFMIITPNDTKSLDKVLKLTKKQPDELTLDLDWSEAEGGGGERRRSARGDRPERSGRGVRRKPEAEPAPVAEAAPAAERSPEVWSDEPRREEPPRSEARREESRRREPRRDEPRRNEPRREEARRDERPRDESRDRPAREPRDSRFERPERRPEPRQERDDPSGGRFGADAPAFLLRPAPVKKLTSKDQA